MKRKSFIKFIALLSVSCLAFALSSCSFSLPFLEDDTSRESSDKYIYTEPKETVSDESDPGSEILPDSGSNEYEDSPDASGSERTATIVISLFPEYAPISVNNFLRLVDEGFYNGLTFHRIDGNKILGGDPNGDGSGGSPERIFGEFSANGYHENELQHLKGTVSMGHESDDYNSASCQFFICTSDIPEYDGQYAPFGKVVSGMEYIEEISSVAKLTNANGEQVVPLSPVRIKNAQRLQNSDPSQTRQFVELTVSYRL